MVSILIGRRKLAPSGFYSRDSRPLDQDRFAAKNESDTRVAARVALRCDRTYGVEQAPPNAAELVDEALSTRMEPPVQSMSPEVHKLP